MAGTPTAFQPDAFQNDAFQTGGVVPPTPTPTPAGGGGKRRRYVRFADGRRREIDDDHDLRRVVRDLIDKKEAQEAEDGRKRKVSRKIRQRKKTLIAGQLQNFAAWDTLNAELRDLELIEERFLWDLLLALMVREQIRQDDEEFMLILEAMT